MYVSHVLLYSCHLVVELFFEQKNLKNKVLFFYTNLPKKVWTHENGKWPKNKKSSQLLYDNERKEKSRDYEHKKRHNMTII